MEYLIIAAAFLLNAYWAKKYDVRVLKWGLLGLLLPVVGNLVMWVKVVQKNAGTASSSAALGDLNVRVSTSRGPTSRISQNISSDDVLVGGEGWFSTEVVGESKYSQNIQRLVGSQDAEVVMYAHLVREPSNRFDPNAVRVDVEGETVGYLSREVAPSFHSLLKYVEQPKQHLLVPARLWWGTDYGSVSLDIQDPDFALNVNQSALPQDAIIWPRGGRLQVAKESEHLDAIGEIRNLAYAKTGCSILLQVFCEETEKGKKLVNLLHDGKKVGELSPQTSTKFWGGFNIPLSSGHKLFVPAAIRASDIAAEIIVFLKAPEEMSTEELQALRGGGDK